ncbi:poly-gamma-glutamate synthesis protein (capsule biosynthesis protein) [Georgenia soli]|uniref:Poly-gamma-glutamate synthesis protein (Capsule biosynthesis protein) n=1 Tax=Georgenia soli TaxID=638953 RepID=A0A2A9EQU4_9MICO|nr:CapA family protein [Georgenia soli]PFG40579.1 poly-gamma-glutamate synthesis protein (capsule biosynthesis protein) [Georgenia soli]
MTAILALAGDTMLGRLVADRITADPPTSPLGPRLRELLRGTDAVVLNLECCISARGRRWPDPHKPFFFRAPPRAAELLAGLGVTAVTLANNHALDYGTEALTDTLGHLADAGVSWVGAGEDVVAARRPAVVDVARQPVTVVGLTDHPASYAAGPDRPGVAFADLRTGVPDWVRSTVRTAARKTPVLVTPHWGPNLVTEPVPHVRRAARALLASGAALVAGHSAHVPHGVEGRVLYDLGDLVDDYAVHPALRNDLGALWLLHLEGGIFRSVDIVPLRLRVALTEVADGDDAEWVRRRLRRACARLGTEAAETREGHLAVGLSAA